MSIHIDSRTLNSIALHTRIIIQPDWSTNVKSNTLPANVWLEFKSGSNPFGHLTGNLHGSCSIKALSDQEAPVYKTLSSDNFISSDIDRKKQQLQVNMEDSRFSHTFQGPLKSFYTTVKDEYNKNLSEQSKARTKEIQTSVYPHWFDISSGGVGLTALSNGLITIWSVENGDIRRKLKGHIEDVYISRFFPSDFAVISGGADLRVRIWSLDTDNSEICNLTLTGHRSRINDVIALNSQHVLSASNDGSIIMWDIKKNEKLNKPLELKDTSVTCMSLLEASSFACVTSDDIIRLHDLNNMNSKEIIHQTKVDSSVTTLCYLPELHQLVYGTERSIIGIHDLRQFNGTPLYKWQEQRGKITSISPGRDRQGLLTTTADGSCFEYNKEEFKSITHPSKFHVRDYTGADDCIRNGKIFNNRIYSICRDGFVRVYDNLE